MTEKFGGSSAKGKDETLNSSEISFSPPRYRRIVCPGSMERAEIMESRMGAWKHLELGFNWAELDLGHTNMLFNNPIKFGI